MTNIVILLVFVTLFEQSWTLNETFSEKELKCFAEERLYHEGTDSCQKLLTRGPCKRGQWFVLEKPSSISANDKPKIRGICVDVKCEDREFYWASTRTCVQPEDKERLCGPSPDEELLHDLFGEGECICKRDPPRARLNGDKKNPCYELYSQGPCSRGKIFVISDDGDDDKDVERAVCMDDPCHEETKYRRRLGTLLKNESLAASENGTCYKLNQQGPCPTGYTFKVHTSYLKPSCVMLTNTIFNLEKPQDCYQDENGDCQKRINANKYQNAEKYKIELFNSVSAARKRRTLRTKDTKDRYYDKKPEMTWFAAHYN